MPRILSAVLLIPLSLWIIYSGPPYTLIFGGILAVLLFIEWGSLCLKNLLPLWQKTIVLLLGTAYISIAILWLFQPLSKPEGWRLLYWILFLVWSTDTAAYVGGRSLKGPKLAPSISPQKTWSGFISGMIGGTFFAYGTSFWLLPSILHFWGIALLVLVAQLGDLLESKLKRWSDVKDSSFLIPGHGGVLDRLDSLLAVAFALALWQWFF